MFSVYDQFIIHKACNYCRVLIFNKRNRILCDKQALFTKIGLPIFNKINFSLLIDFTKFTNFLLKLIP